ncbi:protein FAR1-RELATED SEQUENCE 4 [Cucumis melo var. makuwa]|uniref:Protein FAR1-RELATED SEQUENCE 4 n=1 Tax=Cucumis melo var. makuwa TaxID=1194695 RepID=A0A5A7V7F3_CUCMM|nr:protein FAR1-RELATED SEQUENCE 4 [Cucumis melo var. makuwa]TYK26195.1 protein FAR1-RELATED SEQUENCE 4 [Cucumis melo var. makuwa]
MSSSSSSVWENVDMSLNIDDFIFMSTDHSIPKEIVHKARTNLGVNISYQKAWRAKEHMVKILHGDRAESYALIPRFFDKLVESNPGTCTALEMDDSGHFKFCFMVFGASIEGWKYCRLIFVDGTFLKYSENDVSWTWFFEKIRGSFSERANLVIVSGRHLSIPKGVLKVFLDVEYCVCTKQILSNLKLHFKNPLLDKYFFSRAYAYTVKEFEYHMRCMKSICSNIRYYLSSVGFEKWSRAYSRRRRYRMMKPNCAESVNSVFKDLRKLPVATMLCSIRDVLQK